MRVKLTEEEVSDLLGICYHFIELSKDRKAYEDVREKAEALRRKLKRARNHSRVGGVKILYPQMAKIGVSLKDAIRRKAQEQVECK